MSTAIKILQKDFLQQPIPHISDTPFKIISEEKLEHDAEMHTDVTDLFYLLRGSLQFICNGKLICPTKTPDDPKTFIAKNIKGGKKFLLKPHDWLVIPAQCPHQRITLKKSLFIIIKIPTNQKS